MHTACNKVAYRVVGIRIMHAEYMYIKMIGLLHSIAGSMDMDRSKIERKKIALALNNHSLLSHLSLEFVRRHLLQNSNDARLSTFSSGSFQFS